MEDAIVAYLETYGQPQFLWSIISALQADGPALDPIDVQAHLDALVLNGRIKTVDGGVNAGGTPQVCYAPLGFNG